MRVRVAVHVCVCSARACVPTPCEGPLVSDIWVDSISQGLWASPGRARQPRVAAGGAAGPCRRQGQSLALLRGPSWEVLLQVQGVGEHTGCQAVMGVRVLHGDSQVACSGTEVAALAWDGARH